MFYMNHPVYLTLVLLVGTLRTYLKKISDPWPLIPKEMVFTESGNQGDVWYRALLDLGLIHEGFQVNIA